MINFGWMTQLQGRQRGRVPPTTHDHPRKGEGEGDVFLGRVRVRVKMRVPPTPTRVIGPGRKGAPKLCPQWI